MITYIVDSSSDGTHITSMLFAHAFVNIDTASIVTYRMYVLRTGRAMGADDDEDGDSEFEYAHLESDLQ